MAQPSSWLLRDPPPAWGQGALALRQALVAAEPVAAASISPSGRRVNFPGRNSGKRSRLISELLESPPLVEFRPLKWAGLLRKEEKSMGSKGDWRFHHRLRDRIAAGQPITAIFS